MRSNWGRCDPCAGSVSGVCTRGVGGDGDTFPLALFFLLGMSSSKSSSSRSCGNSSSCCFWGSGKGRLGSRNCGALFCF